MPSPSPSDTIIDFACAHRPVVLVVDDEEGPRQCLRVVLKDQYEVHVAESGERALKILETQPVDVAVLDIRMAGMSGIELLGKLKRHDPGIEVIMLTAYETVETARQALRLGACDYLTKPFDLATVRESVANAVERHAVSAQMQSNNRRMEQLQDEVRQQQLAQEFLKTQGEIYASVIHDINSPLTIIHGFIELINRRISNAPSVSGEDLNVVRDRLNRITQQVSNCIDISRRYLGFLKARPSEPVIVNVNQILSDLDEILRVHPTVQGHRLRVEQCEEQLFAQINGTDLIQILLNIAANAFQSTVAVHTVVVRSTLVKEPLKCDVPGPCELFVKSDQFSDAPPFVSISITDDGPGIPRELLPRIFEPFFTTKTEQHGTGLGMAIVLRLIRESRSALHVHSVPGRGSSFTVYLKGASGSDT